METYYDVVNKYLFGSSIFTSQYGENVDAVIVGSRGESNIIDIQDEISQELNGNGIIINGSVPH